MFNKSNKTWIYKSIDFFLYIYIYKNVYYNHTTWHNKNQRVDKRTIYKLNWVFMYNIIQKEKIIYVDARF